MTYLLKFFLYLSTLILSLIAFLPIETPEQYAQITALPLSTIDDHSDNCDTIPDVFQKVIDLTELNEIPYDLHQYPNGDYLAVGATGKVEDDTEGFLMKFDSTGNIHWTKIIGIDGYTNENFCAPQNDIWETLEDVIILEDSSAIIIGQRTQVTGNSVDQGFIIKVDFNGEIIWSKAIDVPFEDAHVLYNIIDLNRDTFFISGVNNSTGFLFMMAVEDGALLKKAGWGTSFSANFVRPLVTQTDDSYIFFARGRIDSNAPLASLLILKFDFDLNITEAKAINPNNFEYAIWDGYLNLQRKNNNFYLPLGIRNINNNEQTPGLLILDSTFQNVISSKRYIGSSLNTQVFHDIHVHDDGTMSATFANFFGFFDFMLGDDENEAISLLKLNTEGEVLWHRVYRGDGATPYGFIEPTSDDGTIILGSSQGFPTSGNGLYLLRTDSSGMADTCHQESFDIIAEDFPLVFDTLNIFTPEIPFGLEDFFIPSRSIYPSAKDLCCEGLADATIQYLNAGYACGDSIGIDIRVCNVGENLIPAAFPLSLYDQSPLTSSPDVLSASVIGIDIPPDSCIILHRTILIPNTQTVVTVVGDAPELTPYEIPCDFPFTNLEECEYNNNIRSMIIPDSIGIIAFDDDYYLACSNSDYALDLIAPPYLQSPIWNGYLQTDTLVVDTGGWYYLEALTPCNMPFFDSVYVFAEHPNLEFGFTDTTVCLGDTLIFFTPAPFDELIWRYSPGNTLNASCSGGPLPCSSVPNVIICDTLGTFRVSTQHSTLFECTVYDTFYIHIVEYFQDTLPFSFCETDSILILGEYYFSDTTIYDTINTGLSCDSIYTYQLTEIDTSFQEIQFSACTGDTIFWEEEILFPGTSTTFIYPSVQGCDSTIIVTVEELLPSASSENMEICYGDSISVFGVLQNESGIYEARFTNLAGCDSIHQVFLEVYNPILVDGNITPSCPDESNGSIELIIASEFPLMSFDWNSPLATGDINTALPAGFYQLTITNEMGCTGTASFDVPAYSGIDFDQQCTSLWYIPNAFSPNGDQLNDQFTIFGNQGLIEIISLDIFTRKGDHVFGQRNFLPNETALGWDGRFKGKVMNPQVFAYKAVLLTEDGEQVVHGTITLVK